MARTAVIVDDHPMCRTATRLALQVADPDLAVTEAASLGEADDQAAGATLMTLDLALPDNRGALGLRAMLERHTQMRLLVISGTTTSGIEASVAAAGAHGFLSKAASIGEMVEAMRAVLSGRRWFSADAQDGGAADGAYRRLATLTPAQLRVLNAMAGGRLNKQIAHDLGLSEITIKAHVKAILRKLEVPNRTQAILTLQQVEA